MTQSFDVIFKGGTVVNHDGEAVRDHDDVAAVAAVGETELVDQVVRPCPTKNLRQIQPE